jgi:hypothetical protein
MNSIGSFLKRLRDKKAVADAAREGAGSGSDIRIKHAELTELANRTALVALAAERAGAPPEVLQKLGEEAVSAAAERDQYFETEKIQIANAFAEAEQRDQEVN